MPTPTAYSRLQIALHWLIALLIAAAWFTHEGMGKALDLRLKAGETGTAGNTLHVWIGGAVFALILLRLAVRLIRGAPAPVPAGPLMTAAAIWGHRLLYLLMLLVPALGASAWYLGVEPAGEAHEVAATLLVILALGHAAVAIWHHFARRDGTLARMLRPGT